MIEDELKEWLDSNRIQHEFFEDDPDIVEIDGFGKMFIFDLDGELSIFRKGKDKEEIIFSLRNADELLEERIFYCCFKFGNNWYYTDLREDFKLNILKYIGKHQPYEHDVDFVNLGVHTPFELLNSSFMPKSWVQKAKFLEHNAIGICDVNTMAGMFHLQKACKDIKPIFGYSLTVSETISDIKISFGAKVYAQTQKGLRGLLRIQKAINVDGKTGTISSDELMKWAEGNVLVFDRLSFDELISNVALANKIIDAFGIDNCFYQIDATEYKSNGIDLLGLKALKRYIREMYLDEDCPVQFLKPVLISDCYYLDPDDAKNKINLNKLKSGAAHNQSVDQYFKSVDDHWNTLYPLFMQLEKEDLLDFDCFFTYICTNACEIADNSNAKFETGRLFMPKYDMKNDEAAKYNNDNLAMFDDLVYSGLDKLIPKEDQEPYLERLKEEMYVIKATNNVDYFLIQWDLIEYAKNNNILVGYGRGSSAGSLVSYCLGIVSVDPLKYKLSFERFLIPERAGLVETEVTIIGEEMEAEKGSEYYLIEIDGVEYPFYRNAEFMVKDGDKFILKYPDELREGDEIIFDNYDLLWTLNKLVGKH